MVRIRKFLILFLIITFDSSSYEFDVVKSIFYNSYSPSVIDDCVLRSHNLSISGFFSSSSKELSRCERCLQDKNIGYICKQIGYNNSFWQSEFYSAAHYLKSIKDGLMKSEGFTELLYEKIKKIEETKIIKKNLFLNVNRSTNNSYKLSLYVNNRWVAFNVDTGAVFGSLRDKCKNANNSLITLINGDKRLVTYCNYDFIGGDAIPLITSSSKDIIGIAYLSSFEKVIFKRNQSRMKSIDMLSDGDFIFLSPMFFLTMKNS